MPSPGWNASPRPCDSFIYDSRRSRKGSSRPICGIADGPGLNKRDMSPQALLALEEHAREIAGGSACSLPAGLPARDDPNAIPVSTAGCFLVPLCHTSARPSRY